MKGYIPNYVSKLAAVIIAVPISIMILTVLWGIKKWQVITAPVKYF